MSIRPVKRVTPSELAMEGAGVKLRRAPIWVDETCAMNIQRLSLVARKLKRQHGIAAGDIAILGSAALRG